MMQLLSWVQNNSIAQISILIIILYVLNFILIGSLTKISKYYYLILMPGVILHELSHILGCLLTGSRVKSFKLFSDKGGYVIHEKPKLPVIGQAIISTFPLMASGAILIYISKVLPGSTIQVKILLYYISISIILTMLPSKKDISNSIISIPIFIAILYYVVNEFNISQITIFRDMLLSSVIIVLATFLAVNLYRYIWK